MISAGNPLPAQAEGESGEKMPHSMEPLAKLLKAGGIRHSGQAKRDPESRIFKRFWFPAFAGVTA
jgi:hypothetical protein